MLILIAQSVQNVKGHLEYNLKLKTEHHAQHCLIGAANKLIYEASKAEKADEYETLATGDAEIGVEVLSAVEDY